MKKLILILLMFSLFPLVIAAGDNWILHASDGTATINGTDVCVQGGTVCLSDMANASGDITAVIAGTGLTGGGTTGFLTMNVSADTCGAGNVSKYNGTHFDCVTDANDGGSGKAGDGVYLFNDSTTMSFNDTHAGINLAVNSSDNWDDTDTFNATQMEDNGGTLSIITAWLNGVINSLMSNPFDQDLNTTNNVTFNKIDANDWSNVSIIEDQISDLVHTTDTNASTECSGAETLLGNGTCLTITGITDTNATTECSTTEALLGNGTCFNSTLFFDDTTIANTNDGNASSICSGTETLLGNGSCVTQIISEVDPVWNANSSTVARIGDCGAGQFVQNTTTGGVECASPSGSGDITSVQGDNIYIYNGSDSGNVVLVLNETRLNLTIDDRDSDTTYTNGSGLSLVGTEFNHSDTSSQSSSDNSGNTFIQDIILDTYGHITSIVTAIVDISGFFDQDLNTTNNVTFNNITTGSIFTDFIDLNTTGGISRQTGRISWDETAETFVGDMEGDEVRLQMGMEFYLPRRVKNNLAINITNGQAVYMSGIDANRIEVSLAISNSTTTARVIGLATEDILAGDIGYATAMGLVNDINTSMFSEGDMLYLSTDTPGELVNTTPSAPNFVIEVGLVVRSHATTGGIFVNIGPTDVTNGMTIQDLTINNNFTVSGNISGTLAEFSNNITTDNYFNGQYNWTTDDAMLTFDGSTLDLDRSEFNSSVEGLLVSTTYLPTSFQILFGSGAGGNNVGNLSFSDGETFDVDEAAGAPPVLEVYINFTGVDKDPDFITMSHQYAGSHFVQLQAWSYDDSDWETYDTILPQGSILKDSIAFIDGQNHVSGELVQLRFIHPSNGNAADDLILDFVNIVSGFSTVTTNDHDGLSNRGNASNHLWALPTDGSLRNATSIFVTNNITVGGEVLGNINASFVQNNNWIEDSQEGNLNVNNSNTADNWTTSNNGTLSGLNVTQFENEGGLLHLIDGVVGLITSIVAGDGMTFSTVTEGAATVTLGTPGTLNAGTSNGVSANSHLHAITSATPSNGDTTSFSNADEIFDWGTGAFIAQANEGNLNVNSSDNWDDTDTFNATQMVDNGGTLSIITSWLDGVISALISNPFDQTLNTTSNVTFNIIKANNWSNVTIVEDQISDLVHATDTNASVGCAGNTTYLSGDGGCNDISSLYADKAISLPAANITTGTFGTGNYVMDGNLTVEKLVFENDAGHFIEDNATCVFIRGDSSSIEVC